MKKIMTIILLLIVIFSGFYYLNNQAYKVEDILSVEIVDTNERIENDKELIHYLPFITKNDENINQNYDFSNGFHLVFNMNNDKIYHIKLIHDFDTKRILYKNDDEEVFSLNQEDSWFFFKSKSYKKIYKQFEPNFTLFNETEPLKPFKDQFLIEYSFEDQDSLEYIWDNQNQENINVLTNSDLLRLDTTNSTTELLIYDNEELIHVQTDFNKKIFVPEYDGVFKYVFQVKSNHQVEAKVTKSMSYWIEIDRMPVFELSDEQIYQGGFFKINGKYITIDEIQSIETLIVDDIKFYKNGHGVVTYIPIHARTRPGNYNINIQTKNKYNQLFSVEVIDREFRTQHLNITASTMASTSNAEAYDEYNKYFHPLRKISSENQYYDDDFIMPLKARISTEFGEGRSINDAVTSYTHSGLDLAAPKGTSVHSINHGVVTLSRHFALTGNTIIIDHGQGLLSYYFHLDTLNVQLNDQVKTGDIIGTVGSTGRSTGPHLHFGTSFYTTNIEPGYLIYGEPITKDNYENLFK